MTKGINTFLALFSTLKPGSYKASFDSKNSVLHIHRLAPPNITLVSGINIQTPPAISLLFFKNLGYIEHFEEEEDELDFGGGTATLDADPGEDAEAQLEYVAGSGVTVFVFDLENKSVQINFKKEQDVSTIPTTVAELDLNADILASLSYLFDKVRSLKNISKSEYQEEVETLAELYLDLMNDLAFYSTVEHTKTKHKEKTIEQKIEFRIRIPSLDGLVEALKEALPSSFLHYTLHYSYTSNKMRSSSSDLSLTFYYPLSEAQNLRNLDREKLKAIADSYRFEKTHVKGEKEGKDFALKISFSINTSPLKNGLNALIHDHAKNFGFSEYTATIHKEAKYPNYILILKSLVLVTEAKS